MNYILNIPERRCQMSARSNNFFKAVPTDGMAVKEADQKKIMPKGRKEVAMTKNEKNKIINLINDFQTKRSKEGRPLSPATITALNELVCFIVVGEPKEIKKEVGIKVFRSYEELQANPKEFNSVFGERK